MTHPDLAFGLPGGVVIVVAGFVEFSLALTLVVGQALLRLAGRWAAVNAAVCGLYVGTLGMMAGMCHGLQLTAARS